MSFKCNCNLLFKKGYHWCFTIAPSPICTLQNNYFMLSQHIVHLLLIVFSTRQFALFNHKNFVSALSLKLGRYTFTAIDSCQPEIMSVLYTGNFYFFRNLALLTKGKYTSSFSFEPWNISSSSNVTDRSSNATVSTPSFLVRGKSLGV